jgi:hypothetical protein
MFPISRQNTTSMMIPPPPKATDRMNIASMKLGVIAIAPEAN